MPVDGRRLDDDLAAHAPGDRRGDFVEADGQRTVAVHWSELGPMVSTSRVRLRLSRPRSVIAQRLPRGP